MKVAAVLLALVAIASAKSIQGDIPTFNTAYGYLTKYAIPQAERIQKAEEEYLKKSTSNERIVGGSPSALGQFKYQAGLISDIVGITGRGVCGGSLISHNRVLTAAHCWYDGQNQAWRFTVVLGSVLLFSGGTRVETTDVVTHPLWFPLLIRNDIAVARLENSVEMTDIIGVIALPTGTLSTEKFVDEPATASGFGITSTGGGISLDQVLSHVTMTVLDNDRCELFFPGIIQDSNICTSTLGGISTCSGDSGGPLVIVRHGNPILIGITSFGFALSCEIGWPAAFVRVTEYLTFINLLML